MRRSRIAPVGLAGLAVAAGVGLAALRFATPLVAPLVASATLAVLGGALLAIPYRLGRRRSFWVGCSLFGWGYTLLAFGPWCATEVRPYLATAAVLDWFERRATPAAPPALGDSDGDGRPDVIALPSLAVAPTLPTPSRVGPADGPSFERVGHSLFALLAALVGALTARRLHPPCPEDDRCPSVASSTSTASPT